MPVVCHAGLERALQGHHLCPQDRREVTRAGDVLQHTHVLLGDGCDGRGNSRCVVFAPHRSMHCNTCRCHNEGCPSPTRGAALTRRTNNGNNNQNNNKYMWFSHSMYMRNSFHIVHTSSPLQVHRRVFLSLSLSVFSQPTRWKNDNKT